jgi:diguanylate cyclase (GGDEF)-like protein
MRVWAIKPHLALEPCAFLEGPRLGIQKFVLKDPYKRKIRVKMYRVISLVGAAVSIGSIIGNQICAFPQAINIKWLGLLFLCLVSYLASYSKKHADRIVFALFLFLTCVFLPFAYIDSGGNKNNTLGYIFLILIMVSYLYGGWRRVFLVASLVCVFVGMNLLEHYRPDLIATYPDEGHFIDGIIQIPMIIVMCFIILHFFTKEYKNATEKLYHLANYDDLTGLYNRRKFNETMEAIPNAPGRPICLALIDLDNFKAINDTHGHHSGDVVLVEFARLLKQHFDQDRHLVSRWGGDEFAIIYYGAREDLERTLNTGKLVFNTYLKQFNIAAASSISSSIVCFSEFCSKKDLLIAADHLLYLEKQKSHVGCSGKTSVS